MEFGFEENVSRNTLIYCKGNVEVAINMLLEGRGIKQNPQEQQEEEINLDLDSMSQVGIYKSYSSKKKKKNCEKKKKKMFFFFFFR